MTGRIGTRVIVRTVVDWEALQREDFGAQADDGRPLDHVRFVAENGGLDLWFEAFDIDFFEFRSSLRSIAESNLRALHGVDVSFGVDDMSWYDHGNEYIFPIDDDDLFHPELAQLADRAGGLPIALWTATQLINEGSGQLEFRGLPLRAFATNNGGFRSAFVRENFTREDARTLVLRHERATGGLARALGIEVPEGVHEGYTDLGGPWTHLSAGRLSLSVKHPGTLTQLGAALRSDDPLGYMRRSVLTGPCEIPDDYRWAERWIRQIEALWGSLGHP